MVALEVGRDSNLERDLSVDRSEMRPLAKRLSASLRLILGSKNERPMISGSQKSQNFWLAEKFEANSEIQISSLKYQANRNVKPGLIVGKQQPLKYKTQWIL